VVRLCSGLALYPQENRCRRQRGMGVRHICRDTEKRLAGIAASGQKYTIEAVDIFRIEDGKLAEHWDVVDIYGLFKQLGTMK
jgi:hypothetical protein